MCVYVCRPPGRTSRWSACTDRVSTSLDLLERIVGSADRRILDSRASMNNQSDGLVIFNNPTLLTVARCAHCRLADVPWLSPLVVPGTQGRRRFSCDCRLYKVLQLHACAPRVIAAWPTVYLSAAHATYATYAIPSRLLNPCVFPCA